MAAPQLAYSDRLYGTPFEFAYANEFDRPEWDLVLLENLVRAFGNLAIGNPALGPLVLLVPAWALVVVWRRFPRARWLVVVQTLVMSVALASVYYAGSQILLRYLAPVVPLVALAVAAALVGRRNEAPDTTARGPGPPALALAGLALAGAIALTAWIPAATVAYARPTVESMAPRAEARARSSGCGGPTRARRPTSPTR